MDKIKKLLSKLVTTLPKNRVLISVVIAYLIGVVILVITYYLVWLYLFYQDKTNLAELMTLITEVTGTQAIAFISFICGCFIDLNHNGVPDHLEVKQDVYSESSE